MKVQCFGCERELEAPTVEAAAAIFVTHAGLDHKWSYPETALRNYAMNYAEAGERISNDTERRAEIGDIVVQPVTPDRVSDWLSFFDRDALAGNPGWASCYCLEPNVPASPEEPERPWRTVRATSADRLRCGATYGYLAYADGKPAGWVNASKRSDTGLFADVDPSGPGAAGVIAVSCFVVAPPFRKHGVAAALLDRVIADAASRGAQWIEAYPHNAAEGTDASHFRGTKPMYEARGFKAAEIRKNDTVMRLPATSNRA